MIKFLSVTKNQISVDGTLKGIDDSGLLFESKDGKETLTYADVLEQFEGKAIKLVITETVKDESDI